MKHKRTVEEERVITEETVKAYELHLRSLERAENTVRKCTADIRRLMRHAGGKAVTREMMIEYKKGLVEGGYKASSINTYLSNISCFFNYLEWYGLKVEKLNVQKQSFRSEEKELTKEEYTRLVKTAMRLGRERIAMITMTICAMGLRVSELQFLTVQAVRAGCMVVQNKGKIRKVMMTDELQRQLLRYAKKQGIREGIVFCTRTGKAVGRANIWRDMKKLCRDADVEDTKVFPHNLRHLFARTHYDIHKNIAQLADILGHSNINTTRIYTMTSGKEHKKQLAAMKLVLSLKQSITLQRPSMQEIKKRRKISCV